MESLTPEDLSGREPNVDPFVATGTHVPILNLLVENAQQQLEYEQAIEFLTSAGLTVSESNVDPVLEDDPRRLDKGWRSEVG
eukprot:8234325-Prorocentrum_lima.AAC.1